jgi:hypothetical protein
VKNVSITLLSWQRAEQIVLLAHLRELVALVVNLQCNGLMGLPLRERVVLAVFRSVPLLRVSLLLLLRELAVLVINNDRSQQDLLLAVSRN